MSDMIDRIHIGEAEFLLPDEKMPYTLDAIHVPLKNPDGTWKLLTTDLGEKPYFRKLTSTPEEIFTKVDTFKMDFNGYCDTWPSGLWLWSAHKCDDGMVFAFVHRELISRRDPFFRDSFLVGIAVSYDNGDSWKYLGDICSNAINGNTNQEISNMGGIPMYIRGDDIFIYFNDYDADRNKRITGARMKLSETIAAVREEKLPEVKKYSGNGVWDTDPVDGVGAPILPTLEGFHPDSHGSGVYCKPLDRFLMLMQTGGAGKLVMYVTQDGEHFDEHTIVDETGRDDMMQPYSFFMSTDGDCTDDMNEIGREFYIYYPHKSIKTYSYDEFYRRKVVID
ncbi:MAG: hypothetical protein IJ493_08145 [Clostridia bacterium]|nr:hypothetical protein [Clostridia bacterium]